MALKRQYKSVIKQKWDLNRLIQIPSHSLDTVASKQCQATVIMVGSSYSVISVRFREEPCRIHVSGYPDSETIPWSHQAGLGLTIRIWLLWKFREACYSTPSVFCLLGQPLNEHLSIIQALGELYSKYFAHFSSSHVSTVTLRLNLMGSFCPAEASL
jgi:hypothetical protein